MPSKSCQYANLPTKHTKPKTTQPKKTNNLSFNVLRERGLDTRRVIIDDSSSLYHIMNNKKYPPMHIIVSDNDMENRYEQTMLLISTLKHFGYDKNIELKIMHGNHCEYINKTNEKGENIFGQIVSEFILKEKI